LHIQQTREVTIAFAAYSCCCCCIQKRKAILLYKQSTH